MPTLAELRKSYVPRKPKPKSKVKIKLTHEAYGNEEEDFVEIIDLKELRKRMVDMIVEGEDRIFDMDFDGFDDWTEEDKPKYLLDIRRWNQRRFLNESLSKLLESAVDLNICKTAEVVK